MSETNIKLKKSAAYISFAIGVGLFFIKIFAYFLTGSSAIFADALESVVHVLATAMALYSIILSTKPPDESHLYGHGNIEYFSAGVEGFFILLAAVSIIYTSVDKIITGFEIQSLDYGTALIAFAGLTNLLLGLFLVKRGKATDSIALVADGKHVLTDSFTSFGVVFGLILVLITGLKIIDPIVAIIVALNIIFTGYKLIRESIGGLMNETDQKLLTQIVEILIANRKDHWIDIHQLRFWKSAEKVFIDFHLTLPYYFTIRESHEEEEKIEAEIQKSIPTAQVKLHIDYCVASLCKYCKYKECKVRKEDFANEIVWDKKKLIGEALVLKAENHKTVNL